MYNFFLCQIKFKIYFIRRQCCCCWHRQFFFFVFWYNMTLAIKCQSLNNILTCLLKCLKVYLNIYSSYNSSNNIIKPKPNWTIFIVYFNHTQNGFFVMLTRMTFIWDFFFSRNCGLNFENLSKVIYHMSDMLWRNCLEMKVFVSLCMCSVFIFAVSQHFFIIPSNP